MSEEFESGEARRLIDHKESIIMILNSKNDKLIAECDALQARLDIAVEYFDHIELYSEQYQTAQLAYVNRLAKEANKKLEAHMTNNDAVIITNCVFHDNRTELQKAIDERDSLQAKLDTVKDKLNRIVTLEYDEDIDTFEGMIQALRNIARAALVEIERIGGSKCFG